MRGPADGFSSEQTGSVERTFMPVSGTNCLEHQYPYGGNPVPAISGRVTSMGFAWSEQNFRHPIPSLPTNVQLN